MTSPAQSPAAAVDLLLARVRPVGVETVTLDAAAGRVLAEPLLADRDSPAADVSAMDGYAVRLASLKPARVGVCAEVRIGREPPRLESGCAVRIVTGGGVPEGADAVIKREDVTERGGGDGEIELAASTLAALKPGQNIRRRAENLRQGQQVVPAGAAITPPVVGALATFGRTEVRVHRRVRVAILVTGDEVCAPGEPVSSWQLRDSNGPALAAMLGGPAWAEVLPRTRCADEPEALLRAVSDMLAAADVLFLTGGVSMGDRDFVPAVLRQAGVDVLFHKVPQRPGKPALGAIAPRGGGGQAILALPGNPLSVMVTARRMGAPVLRRLAGITSPEPRPRIPVNDDGKRLELWWHRLVRITETGAAELVDTRGSGDIPSAARSDGFVEIPPGEGGGDRDYFSWTIG